MKMHGLKYKLSQAEPNFARSYIKKYIGQRESACLYICAGRICFPLRRPLSVALLLLSHVFELGKFF